MVGPGTISPFTRLNLATLRSAVSYLGKSPKKKPSSLKYAPRNPRRYKRASPFSRFQTPPRERLDNASHFISSDRYETRKRPSEVLAKRVDALNWFFSIRYSPSSPLRISATNMSSKISSAGCLLDLKMTLVLRSNTPSGKSLMGRISRYSPRVGASMLPRIENSETGLPSGNVTTPD